MSFGDDTFATRIRSTERGTAFVDFVHEVGTTPEDSVLSREIEIGELFPSTSKIVIKSRLVDSRVKLNSPEYLASVRRKKMHGLAKQIRKLGALSDSDEFIVWSHEILVNVRELLHKLIDASEITGQQVEGNSCEILRCLRDSLMSGGWEKYRDPEVQEAVCLLIEEMGNVDEVNASHLDRMLDIVDDFKLSTILDLFRQV